MHSAGGAFSRLGRQSYRLLALSVLAILGGGCARVRVYKVPTPSQYVRWTDEMQRKADGIEGFRFYLPRPFLNVFESFPVRTDIYLADGVVSPDGKYVIIKRIKAESSLASYMAMVGEGAAVPKRVVRWPTAENFTTQSTAEEQARDAAAKAAAQTASTGVAGVPPTESSTSPPTQPTGITRKQVTNDNGAYAYQPMRGNLDIAYLPDFEEQYAVSGRSGLGNAQFALNLGQGWSLQGFNSLTDNSALNARVFDLIDTSIRLAKSAAGGLIPGGLSALAPGATQFTPQSLADEGKDAIPGTAVSLKIVVVHYAAKGLYPVLKPRELQERLVSAYDDYVFFDLFKWFPNQKWQSQIDPSAIMRAQQAIDNESGRFTVPRYPYQYVSFNTFRYLAIEVLKADAAPFGTLYDKTGTTGDPGDRRVDLPPSQPPGTGGGSTPPPPDDAEKEKALLQADINARIFKELPHQAVVAVEKEKFVIHIENKDVKSWTKEDRDNLQATLRKELASKVEIDRVQRIEYPPTQPEIEAFTTKANTELKADGVVIKSISIEVKGTHAVELQGTVSDEYKKKLEALFLKEFKSSGSRTLSFK